MGADGLVINGHECHGRPLRRGIGNRATSASFILANKIVTIAPLWSVAKTDP